MKSVLEVALGGMRFTLIEDTEVAHGTPILPKKNFPPPPNVESSVLLTLVAAPTELFTGVYSLLLFKDTTLVAVPVLTNGLSVVPIGSDSTDAETLDEATG